MMQELKAFLSLQLQTEIPHFQSVFFCVHTCKFDLTFLLKHRNLEKDI